MSQRPTAFLYIKVLKRECLLVVSGDLKPERVKVDKHNMSLVVLIPRFQKNRVVGLGDFNSGGFQLIPFHADRFRNPELVVLSAHQHPDDSCLVHPQL
jgi:hypothetical protein